jgi:hypothetical protein
MRAVGSNGVAAWIGDPRRFRFIDPDPVAGGMLRLPSGCAAGVKPTVDPVKRIMVNVGSAPSATGRWWRSARRDVR